MDRGHKVLAVGMGLTWTIGLATGFFAGRMWEMAHSTFEEAALAAARPWAPQSTAQVPICGKNGPRCGEVCLDRTGGSFELLWGVCSGTVEGGTGLPSWMDEPLPPRRNLQGDLQEDPGEPL